MKWIRRIVAFFLLFIMGFVLLMIYEFHFALTHVGTEVSPNGRYRIVLQEKGEPDWPYGESHARATVYDGDKVLKVIEEDIADDGASFTKMNYTVTWDKEQVLLHFHGSEQETVEYVVDLTQP